MSLIAYVQMKLCFSLFFQLFFIILKISPDFRHFIADYSKGFYFSLVFSFFYLNYSLFYLNVLPIPDGTTGFELPFRSAAVGARLDWLGDGTSQTQ